MTKSQNPLAQISVRLSVPVPVMDADGRDADRSTLTLRRPQTRHVKQLAVLVGADIVKLVLEGHGGETGTETTDIDMRKIAVDVAQRLLTIDRLDGLTAIVADLCGETAELIDSVDPVDLFELLKAFTGFFPSLLSFASTISVPK